VAIALSILVLLGFRYLEERRLAQRAKSLPPVPRQVAPAVQLPPVEKPEVSKETPEVANVPAEAVSRDSRDTSSEPRTVVVEGDGYRAVLDNRGAILSSFRLLGYRSGPESFFEMIAAQHDPESRPYPGTVITDDPETTRMANNSLYEVTIEGNVLGGVLAAPATVHLRFSSGGYQVEKSYRFEKENYLVGYTVSVERDGKAVSARLFLGQDIGPEYDHLQNPGSPLRAIANIAGKVVREGAPKEEGQIHRTDGDIRWVGLDIRYFSLIAIPKRPIPAFELQKKVISIPGLDGKTVSRDLLKVSVPFTGSEQFVMFIGPKDKNVLEAVPGADFSGVIDYGMFSFLVRPLLFSLKFIERYVHNYGVAIILLTLLLTLLLFPFRLKQVLSMKKMAVVQPKVKEIQERYKRYKKTDPKRAEMNQEIMALYKEHNVNPLGGCLPLILQMPLLFAFYQLLASSIELRQAPFVAWIQDLSIKDPYYVLPIVMGLTMLISQKMTPASPGADPTQAKMMMMMPVIFTVMFLNVSSGLNLYFLCSNIFQISFQKLTEGWMGDGKARKAAA